MSSEAPQLDILETSKEKFVNLISELNDSQFHSFQEFVQSALGKKDIKKMPYLVKT